MLEEPTQLRIEDPGVRALFTEAARFQSWLDVEAALAGAQAELGIIPKPAAEEICRKAHLRYLDLEAVRAGLAKTGHPLVPLVWALDRACDGDAGGYVHWGATTQDILLAFGWRGLRLTLTGLAIGLVLAALGARFLTALFYGFQPSYLAMIATVSFILLAVAVLACFLPARRASQVDPVVAFRNE